MVGRGQMLLNTRQCPAPSPQQTSQPETPGVPTREKPSCRGVWGLVSLKTKSSRPTRSFPFSQLGLPGLAHWDSQNGDPERDFAWEGVEIEELHAENKTVSKRVSPMSPGFSDALRDSGGSRDLPPLPPCPPPAPTPAPMGVPRTERMDIFNLRFLEGESRWCQQAGVFRVWARHWGPRWAPSESPAPRLPGPQDACCWGEIGGGTRRREWGGAFNPRGSEAPAEIRRIPCLFSERKAAKSACWGPELPR